MHSFPVQTLQTLHVLAHTVYATSIVSCLYTVHSPLNPPPVTVGKYEAPKLVPDLAGRIGSEERVELVNP